METSSKTGFNVKRLFCKIGKILYEQTMKDNEVDKVRKNTFNIYIFLFNINRKLIPEIAMKISNMASKSKKSGCC